MDYSTATPVEIDTELAELYGKMEAPRRYIAEYSKIVKEWDTTKVRYSGSKEHYERKLEEFRAEVARLRELAAPGEAEFTARRWTRFFICQHVHSSQSCHTLYPTSQIGWLPFLSGSTESETVDQLGEAACTVCFPSAPVNKPNTIELDPAKAARKAEREARATELAAKRAASAITFEDGSPVMEYLPGTERYNSAIKTERTAIIAATDALVYAEWGYGEKYMQYFEYIFPALVFKSGRDAEELRAELVAKAAKKAKR